MHTTNYFNTFIEIAEDCPIGAAEVPPQKGEAKSVANMQFELIAQNPYKYTADEVIFGIHALRNGLSNNEAERAAFFSKGQACLRASPLAKRYAWGIHHDAEGRVAIFPAESEDYQRLAADPSLNHTKAMRSKRA
ncbi:MAG: hypothetical protein IT258_15510 [Saprospiraceae bacterium]|nr:hypothetical protein [Saprospiraceae bacterium]